MVKVLFIFAFLLRFANTWDNNMNRIGIYQQGGVALSPSSVVRGVDFHFGWNDVEPANNVWNFSAIEQTLDEYIVINPNLSIILLPTTGNTAPLWLYAPPINIPAVYINTTKNESKGPFPYYLNSNYQTYFKRYVKKVYEFIINSKYYPKHIFVTQVMLGSSGDCCPWHGTPLNSSYDISTTQWWNYTQVMSLYFYNIYYNSTPNTVPNLLLLFNFDHLNHTEGDFYTDNCPGSYRKAGSASHGYQLNTEMEDYMYLGNLIRNVTQSGIQIRGRGEVDSHDTEGSWTEAPYWNLFSLSQWHLTFGLDIPGYGSGYLNNVTYKPIFDFFNLFAKYKHTNANVSIGAFIGLRDGLDSNDTNRFPESIFGNASINNSQRMILIANNMSIYGAKQEDPEHGTGSPMHNRHATALNDVGFGIWRVNYGKFMEQINPMNTSQGRWRIGSMTDEIQMYGRFGRSFDYKSGKNTMCFVLDKDLWGGLPLKFNINLYFNVTYFDDGNGKWTFGYDAIDNKNKMSVTVKKTDTNKWIIKNFNINDAYFGQRGVMNSDFCLYSNDTTDDIFSFIQVIAV
eukprot:527748_1